MKTGWNGSGWGMVLVGALLIVALTACEDTDRGTAIVVTPDTSVLYVANATVVLTAAPAEDPGTSTNEVDMLFLPLEWSVSDPRLGGIVSSGGYTAVYASTGRVGQQNIRVKDQGGSDGVAVINQRPKTEQSLMVQ